MSAKAKNKADETTEDIVEETTALEVVEDQNVEEAPAEEQQDEVLDKEFERFIPEDGEPLELSDGTLVYVKPLRLNGLFAAFKIVTRGSVMSMGTSAIQLLSDSQDAFAETLIALLINAIPEASFETAEFLRECVEPVPPTKGWVSAGDERHANDMLDRLLLDDPEIDDAFDIISTVVYRESRDIQRLGKKIRSAAKMFEKTQKKSPTKD